MYAASAAVAELGHVSRPVATPNNVIKKYWIDELMSEMSIRVAKTFRNQASFFASAA